MPERAGWLAIALILDAWLGDPDWLWRKFQHPVVWCGKAITWCEARWNQGDANSRRFGGLGTVMACVGGAAAVGWLIEIVAGWLPIGSLIEMAAVFILLAQGSMAKHARAVALALADSLDKGRDAVSLIVGRDPKSLDESGVARAAIESVAENFSDGVVAPALAYLVFGLPGLFAYKALNTADSMIGHRSAQYEDFGFFAAKLDDVANFVPARLSALFLIGAALMDKRDAKAAVAVVKQDAAKHRSPNAGWPEAAMAGALDLSLAGPRTYEGQPVDDAWMHPAGRRTCGAAEIHASLRLFWLACGLQAVLVAAIWLVL
jgi:adenosylcobinamide-phosphate synthase